MLFKPSSLLFFAVAATTSLVAASPAPAVIAGCLDVNFYHCPRLQPGEAPYAPARCTSSIGNIFSGSVCPLICDCEIDRRCTTVLDVNVTACYKARRVL
ncbi:hypothetical protein C8R43DRAFT_1132316 [Mycena crocata]|nr:hypothetical protein C8R43DRAFT_1132316 [Mycena crocata]